MSIVDLLQANKISQYDYDNYQHFHENPLGQKWLMQMVQTTFNETPPPEVVEPSFFVFLDGRKSIFRDIQSSVRKCIALLKEQLERSQNAEVVNE